MTTDPDLATLSPDQRNAIERAWAEIDARELMELARSLVEIPSRTGEERPIAEFLVGFMRDEGLAAFLQPITDSRANAIGVLRGDGDGPGLAFNGHLDTSCVGEVAEDYPMTGSTDLYLPVPRIEGDLLFGLGAANMKGGIASLVGAACAMRKAGIRLGGTVTVTAVAGEIEKAPIDGLFRSYAGSHFLGAGVGTRFLLEHGHTPRYAVVGEPTGLHLSRAVLGVIDCVIEVRGSLAYTNRKHHGRSALLGAARLTAAIEEEFAPAYSLRHRFNGEDMTLIPNVIVGAIESGWPFKPGYTPAIARLYVDLRTSPFDAEPTAAYRELVEFLADFATSHDIEISSRPFLTRVPGTATQPDSPLVIAARAAYRDVVGSDPAACPAESTSFSDDSNILRQHGCDTITIGPAGPRDMAPPFTGGRGEFVSLSAIEQAARIYVAIAVRLLGLGTGRDGSPDMQ